MGGAAGLDWICVAAGWALAVAGVVAFLWAMWWDRSRGRRRCPRCWYEMAGVPGLKCPECGREAKSEKRLLRTRRRWVAAALAIVVGLGGAVAMRLPVILRYGWRRAVPSAVLVFVAPMGDQAWTWQGLMPGYPRFGAPADGLLIELMRRSQSRELRPWQYQVLLDRVFRAQPDQVGFLLRTRDCWPCGLPVRVDPVGATFVGGDDVVLWARIKGSGRGWAEWPMVLPDARPRHMDDLGVPPEGARAFDIEAELVRVGSGRKEERLWSGTIQHARVVDAAGDAMKPVSGADVDFAVLDLGPHLARGAKGRVTLGLYRAGYHIGGSRRKDEPPIDWALGARCEVIRDDKVVAVGEVVYPMVEPGTIVDYFGMPYEYFDLVWDGTPPSSDVLEGSWRIRLVGDASVAIRDLKRTWYWNGEVETSVRRIGSAADSILRR